MPPAGVDEHLWSFVAFEPGRAQHVLSRATSGTRPQPIGEWRWVMQWHGIEAVEATEPAARDGRCGVATLGLADDPRVPVDQLAVDLDALVIEPEIAPGLPEPVVGRPVLVGEPQKPCGGAGAKYEGKLSGITTSTSRGTSRHASAASSGAAIPRRGHEDGSTDDRRRQAQPPSSRRAAPGRHA